MLDFLFFCLERVGNIGGGGGGRGEKGEIGNYPDNFIWSPEVFWTGWLVELRFNTTLTAKVRSWQSVTHMTLCFLAFTNFFPKPPTTFLTCFSRGERRIYARKKFHLKWVSNSQPSGHEFDTLTTETPRRGKMFSKGL